MTHEALIEHELMTLRCDADDYRRQSLRRLVRPYVRGKSVLDMRCITGQIAVTLALEGFDVMALDDYPDGVRMTNDYARRMKIEREIARPWDFTKLPERVDGRQFDTVLCMDILNHVREDERAVQEIYQVTQAGGRLILVVPAVPWLKAARDEALGHLRRYDRRHLVELVEKSGFRVTDVRYWNFAGLPLYVLIEKILKRKISDEFRFVRYRKWGMIPNRILTWWFRIVENHVRFPVGLSLFLIAEKDGLSR